MVGAIPFDTRKPSSLFIPQRWQTFSRPARQQSARYASGAQTLNVQQRTEIPSQPVFEEMVARAASLTATPQVNKVVLSRLIDIATDKQIDSSALMERLIAQNPASFNFHVPLEDGGVLLGASPELLLRKRARTLARCRWQALRAVSRTMCWIAKRALSCWPPKKTATSTIWSRRR